MIRVRLTEEHYNVRLQDDTYQVGMGISYEANVPVDQYEGDYEYTPSREAQIIPINGKKATDNITINPIPSNYGLITWDGSIITVS